MRLALISLALPFSSFALMPGSKSPRIDPSCHIIFVTVVNYYFIKRSFVDMCVKRSVEVYIG